MRTCKQVRDVGDARLRLRDIGALPRFCRMLGENLRDNLLVSLVFSLARAEPLHSALKQEVRGFVFFCWFFPGLFLGF